MTGRWDEIGPAYVGLVEVHAQRVADGLVREALESEYRRLFAAIRSLGDWFTCADTSAGPSVQTQRDRIRHADGRITATPTNALGMRGIAPAAAADDREALMRNVLFGAGTQTREASEPIPDAAPGLLPGSRSAMEEEFPEIPKRQGRGGRVDMFDWEVGYRIWKAGRAEDVSDKESFRRIAEKLGCKLTSPKNKLHRWKKRLAVEQLSDRILEGATTVECPDHTCQKRTRTNPCEHCGVNLPVEQAGALERARRVS